MNTKQNKYGWVGVDLDRTLAFYENKMSRSPTFIGEPIPKTVALVKRLLEQGTTVKVFTARVSNRKKVTPLVRYLTRLAIEDWCKEHLGAVLEVTCEKDEDMVALIDDRAVGIHMNTGEISDTRPLWF